MCPRYDLDSPGNVLAIDVLSLHRFSRSGISSENVPGTVPIDQSPGMVGRYLKVSELITACRCHHDQVSRTGVQRLTLVL